METLRPVNQKSVYHSAGDLYEKIMNGKILTDQAKNALKALTIMNTAYIAELKRWELEQSAHKCIGKTELRIVETKNFDNISIEEKVEGPEAK